MCWKILMALLQKLTRGKMRHGWFSSFWFFSQAFCLMDQVLAVPFNLAAKNNSLPCQLMVFGARREKCPLGR
jgi:hypothetical protein